MAKKPAHAPDWQRFVPYALLAVAVFAAYSGVFHNAFLYDDERLIVHNAFLRSFGHVPDIFTSMLSAGDGSANPYYRPMQILLYLIVFQIAGLSTVAFHLLNVGLHAANAGLAWRLGSKLGFAPAAAFAAALIWALHPINTEAVTYMSATADVLQAFFCLLGVIVLLPDFAPRRVALATAFMVLGLLSKETSIAFPLLAASCVYVTSKKRFDWRSYVCLWPLVAVALIYVVLHVILTPHIAQAAHGAVVGAAMTADFEPFATLPLFLRLLAWPAGLHMEHDMLIYATPWHRGAIVGFAIVVTAVFLAQRTANRKLLPLTWGLLWFFAAHAPLIFLNHKAYEHWLYLPAVGLILGAAQSLAFFIGDMPKKQARLAGHGIFVAVLAVAAGFASLTYAQNRIWLNPESFFGNTLAYGEDAPNFHINLGIFYARRGDYDKAIEQYRQAIAIKGGNALAPNNLATVESDWGTTLLSMPGDHNDEALEHFQDALDADPDSYQALHALGEFYAQHGDATKAALYKTRARAAQARFSGETVSNREGQN